MGAGKALTSATKRAARARIALSIISKESFLNREERRREKEKKN